jgi:N-acetylmuramoyl-L-alanine amidase
MKKYLWLIDPGHGSNTPGKRSPVWGDGTQLLEWEFNRKIAALLIRLLQSEGFKYEVIVSENKDIPLSKRAKRANLIASKNKDYQCVYISIHGNAGPEKASGIEVFTSPGQTKSDKFATILLKELAKLGWKMRYDRYRDGDPDKEAKFTVLTKTSMPAVLSENGFYTNEQECKKMLSDEGQVNIALAHFKAIEYVEKTKAI